MEVFVLKKSDKNEMKNPQIVADERKERIFNPSLLEIQPGFEKGSHGHQAELTFQVRNTDEHSENGDRYCENGDRY